MGYPPGEPFFSVCGWLCGQIQIQKFKPAEKVLKHKKNPAFPAGKTGLSGAAGRIRTAQFNKIKILKNDPAYDTKKEIAPRAISARPKTNATALHLVPGLIFSL